MVGNEIVDQHAIMSLWLLGGDKYLLLTSQPTWNCFL